MRNDTAVATGIGDARAQAVVLAWLAGLAMVVLATSVVGLVAAPVAVPGAAYVAARRTRSWAVRVPLLLGALALTALLALWLLDGASTGTIVTPG